MAEFGASPEEVRRVLPAPTDATYQAVLEAQASEHSARMVAMRNATDAAGRYDDLTEHNTVRKSDESPARPISPVVLRRFARSMQRLAG
ncbi:MAG: F0F1 ATP synthase subunit gamma [Planctomycetes bacterium]|nr:F0F1 ATP synthase subunit gamma [Planctomycetota bacterium]